MTSARSVMTPKRRLAFLCHTAGGASPRLDGFLAPHFAHPERHYGGRKVGSQDELLDALAADAEHDADLLRADEMVTHNTQYALDYRYLTSGHAGA